MGWKHGVLEPGSWSSFLSAMGCKSLEAGALLWLLGCAPRGVSPSCWYSAGPLRVCWLCEKFVSLAEEPWVAGVEAPPPQTAQLSGDCSGSILEPSALLLLLVRRIQRNLGHANPSVVGPTQ